MRCNAIIMMLCNLRYSDETANGECSLIPKGHGILKAPTKPLPLCSGIAGCEKCPYVHKFTIIIFLKYFCLTLVFWRGEPPLQRKGKPLSIPLLALHTTMTPILAEDLSTKLRHRFDNLMYCHVT